MSKSKTSVSAVKGKRKRIPREDLLYHRSKLNRKFRNVLRKAFSELRKEGFTQKDVAELIGIDAALVSRRLNGETNMTVAALSDMARAMEIDLEVGSMHWRDSVEKATPEVVSWSGTEVPPICHASEAKQLHITLAHINIPACHVRPDADDLCLKLHEPQMFWHQPVSCGGEISVLDEFPETESPIDILLSAPGTRALQ